ncbi:hypothetical protein MTO96_007299 [Rhipicephalus appendiculatus]
MAPMPPLSGLSAADNAGSHRRSPPASSAASRASPTPSSAGSSLVLRGVLTASSGRPLLRLEPQQCVAGVLSRRFAFLLPALSKVALQERATALSIIMRAFEESRCTDDAAARASLGRRLRWRDQKNALGVCGERLLAGK